VYAAPRFSLRDEPRRPRPFPYNPTTASPIISKKKKFSPPLCPLCLHLLALLLLDLQQQRPIDVGQDTAESNSGANEGVELLVAADSELQVAGGDAFDLEVLGGVARQLQHLGRQVLQHCCQVDGCFGADARLLPRDRSQVALYAPAWELRPLR